MDSIYCDAYPDVFATFDDDNFSLLMVDIRMQRLEDSDKEDAENVEVLQP